MKFNGTKGKWICSGVMNFSGTLVSYIQAVNGEKPIAQLRGCETGQEVEAASNAKLIAAAPELFDALREALIEMEEQYSVNPDQLLKDRIDQSREALENASSY